MSEYIFTEIPLDQINAKDFNDFPTKTVFTTLEWIEFIGADQKAKPIILKIQNGCKEIGYFSGAVSSMYGVKIFGSPFRGWSTCFMGIDMEESAMEEIVPVYKALIVYLFNKYGCHFLEIVDRNITFIQAKQLTDHVRIANTLEVDIGLTNEQIFRGFKGDCRNFIRQFERRGASIERVEPTEEFAIEYYKQLEDVFAKQGLVPTYSLKKVITLLNSLKNTEYILCLQVKSPDGEKIASSIFLGFGRKFFFWGGASYRQHQMYRPNEYMIWYAIQYWKEKGCTIFDMVGIREYKRKFGSIEIEYPRMIFSRYLVLVKLRIVAERLYYKMIRIKGLFVKKPKPSETFTNKKEYHED